MGLFWGNDDVKVKQPQKAEEPKKKDKRLEPLVLENYAGSGYASQEFGFLFRDMHEAVRNNNSMIAKMYDMVKQLLKENEEMRSRMETLEKQVQQSTNPPLERAM